MRYRKLGIEGGGGAEYGNLSLGEVTVDQAIGGGRDVQSMYYETSLLDKNEVKRFSSA